MNFEEWCTHYRKLHPNSAISLYDAWEASKAEERERCAKVAEKSTVESNNSFSATAWNGACEAIAEQIRKGD